MSKKIRKHLTFSHDTFAKLEEIAQKKQKSLSYIAEHAINEYYKKLKDTDNQTNILKKITDELNRLNVIYNEIDRNNKMMIEFWNHYFVVNSFNELATTEKYKTKEVIEAEELINKRIIKQRQRKLDKIMK